jgi:hypothetical protein
LSIFVGEPGESGKPGEPGTPGTPGTPGEPGTVPRQQEPGDPAEPGEPREPADPEESFHCQSVLTFTCLTSLFPAFVCTIVSSAGSPTRNRRESWIRLHDFETPMPAN